MPRRPYPLSARFTALPGSFPVQTWGAGYLGAHAPTRREIRWVFKAQGVILVLQVGQEVSFLAQGSQLVGGQRDRQPTQRRLYTQPKEKRTIWLNPPILLG